MASLGNEERFCDIEGNLISANVSSLTLCGGIELHNNLTKLQITLLRRNKNLDKRVTCNAVGSQKNHNGRSIMELVVSQ